MQQTIKRLLDDMTGSNESIIPAQTQIKGTISGIESVRIAGQIEGNVKSDKLVWLQKSGDMKGNINARHVIIEGKLTGNVKDAEHVEIKAEAHISGNIRTHKIVMAEGSFLKGEIHMAQKVDKPTHFVEKKQTK